MLQLTTKLKPLLAQYSLRIPDCDIGIIQSGLINHTYKVSDKSTGKNYILQQINDRIFEQPRLIAENVENIAAYLEQHFPDYLFVTPLKTAEDQSIICTEGKEWYRLFPFIDGSHTISKIDDAEQAYEAARQFGRFTRILCNYPVERLHATLPGFHDLSLRFSQFRQALVAGNPQRINETKNIAKTLHNYSSLNDTYKDILKNPAFKLRVTHHDTKISNALFNKNQQGLCVIDLDTVMPGFFISDVGDMFRTYLSEATEEEAELGKVTIRMDYFKAFARGYLHEMMDELSDTEIQHFVYAGKFMVYMQALRFYTDYLNNDAYYPVLYSNHNLTRTQNQLKLLREIEAHESEMQAWVMAYASKVSVPGSGFK